MNACFNSTGDSVGRPSFLFECGASLISISAGLGILFVTLRIFSRSSSLWMVWVVL